MAIQYPKYTVVAANTQVESSRSNKVKRSTLETNSVRSLNFGTLKQMGVSNHHWPAGRAHSYVNAQRDVRRVDATVDVIERKLYAMVCN